MKLELVAEKMLLKVGHFWRTVLRNFCPGKKYSDYTPRADAEGDDMELQNVLKQEIDLHAALNCNMLTFEFMKPLSGPSMFIANSWRCL
jgi:hypothetical protein